MRPDANFLKNILSGIEITACGSLEVSFMEVANQQSSIQQDAETPTLRISMIFVAYLALLSFALLVRVADIDIIPMTDAEAVQALPALHLVNSDTPGSAQIAQSPVNFWLQVIAFTGLGATEFAARLPGLLAGTVLVLMPLLFRQHLGQERTFLMSLLLALSPIGFVASRSAAPVMWSMIFALALIWALWRYWETHSKTHAFWSAALLAGLVFLSSPHGLWIAATMGLAAMAALWWQLLNAPDELDNPGDELLLTIRDMVQRYPWQQGLGILALTIVAVATGLMLNPSGLSMIGQMLTKAFSGWVQLSQAGAPLAFGILSLVIYEPLLLLFGLIAVLLLLRQQIQFIGRFMIMWALIALFVLAIYRGATAADALWVLIPLVWLASYAGNQLFTNRAAPIYLLNEYYDDDGSAFWWVKWILAVAVCGLLLMLTLHLGEVGRGLIDMPPDGSLTMLFEARFVQFRHSFVWLVITSLFLLVGFFFASSVWGNDNTVQGFGLGLFFFMLGAGMSTGWNTAVEHATNPLELWHITNPSDDTYLLRETLFELSERDTMGFSELALTIVTDDAGIIRDDRLVAWLVRDFENARFVASAADAARDGVVLLPFTADEPALGGSYVGQSFILRQTWSLGELRLLDLPGWWIQRRTRTTEFASESIVLWLRQDVYDGVPPQERTRG